MSQNGIKPPFSGEYASKDAHSWGTEQCQVIGTGGPPVLKGITLI